MSVKYAKEVDNVIWNKLDHNITNLIENRLLNLQYNLELLLVTEQEPKQSRNW